jgi:uncharacterized protein YciU (UPF0263 family)
MQPILLEVADESMSDPDEDAIQLLFSKYGKKAAEQMVEKMKDWQSKVKWN